MAVKTPTETEWQTVLDAGTDFGFRQAPAIRTGLLSALKPLGNVTAAELHAFWSEVTSAVEQYADRLSQDAGEELPDDDALLRDPHLSEAVGAYLQAHEGEHHQVFLSRVDSAVGLFKLFEAWEHHIAKRHRAAAENLIDAAVLECGARLMRERSYRTTREAQMEAKIAATKSKNQKGGNDKNAVYQAWKKEIIAAYANYKKSLVGKLNKTKAAKELKEKLPHIGVDLTTIYRWISAHDASKPPKKLIEHL